MPCHYKLGKSELLQQGRGQAGKKMHREMRYVTTPTMIRAGAGIETSVHASHAIGHWYEKRNLTDMRPVSHVWRRPYRRQEMSTMPNLVRFSILAILLAVTLAPTCSATVEPDLTTAIRANHMQQAGTLLSEGANVNERDESMEQTPLMWAVQADRIDMVRLLLAHGAAVNLKDDAGQTAWSLAEQKGYRTIAALLVKTGAKREAKTASQSVSLWHVASGGERR